MMFANKTHLLVLLTAVDIKYQYFIFEIKWDKLSLGKYFEQ